MDVHLGEFADRARPQPRDLVEAWLPRTSLGAFTQAAVPLVGGRSLPEKAA
ncbi:hypothetical protein [Pseudofrankia inefficax]|uniref:Uncharacterized protein n=1 Tax=Pseudofrankia inefficax (strain DSM 45817 / CECT 9037 / DDB 130130 / EuI1c) TaxID=298654 RepID=E3IVB4_PSEI1|nr:hypothetical protein [Pseudofrankia inefficax]ADP81278.1 hypothetical protein FraEuI1c_3265 [Pseudofrankia inefficax]